MRKIPALLNTFLLLAVCFLLYCLTVSFDRSRQASLLLAEKISSSASAAVSTEIHQRDGDFANREYFVKDAPDQGKLVSIIASDPPGLNPLIFNEASAAEIFALCSLSLAERDWQHPEKFRPQLAESFTISPDRKSYHIKLRKGVMWQPFTDPVTGKTHPAKEVTASDIKFTVDIIRDPKVNCAPQKVYYADLQEVKVINDHELTITWAKEFYGSIAATLGLFPMPRHFYAPDGDFDGEKFNNDHKRNRMIVSCGPYIFRSWESSRRIRLERNPAYLGNDFGAKPPVKERIFEIIKLPNTRFQALLAGRINMLSLTAEQWMTRTGIQEFTSGKLKKLRYPDCNGYSYIGYNHKIPCFSDGTTRRALTMLVNRQKILDQLLYGCATIAKGAIIPDSAYSAPDLKPHPFDPEKAGQLLKEAGWADRDGNGILERDGREFSFTMLQISGSTMQQRAMLIIKEDFAKAGIDMKLQNVEWSVLLEKLKKQEFESCMLGWRNSIEPDLYQIFHSSQSMIGGDNFISFKNARLDELIEAMRKEFDMEKRIAIAREMELIIHHEQPYTFLFCNDALWAMDSALQNIRLFPNNIHPLSFYCAPEEIK
ncbi:MAG: hypothetical protein IKC82_01010 [Lentisphaeria bacterium]|nr:hypothetical protein [Lentisphaeria bacterium]